MGRLKHPASSAGPDKAPILARHSTMSRPISPLKIWRGWRWERSRTAPTSTPKYFPSASLFSVLAPLKTSSNCTIPGPTASTKRTPRFFLKSGGPTQSTLKFLLHLSAIYASLDQTEDLSSRNSGVGFRNFSHKSRRRKISLLRQFHPRSKRKSRRTGRDTPLSKVTNLPLSKFISKRSSLRSSTSNPTHKNQ